MWDAVMNYQFTRAVIAFVVGEEVNQAELSKTSLHPPGPSGARAFHRAIERLIGLYHPNVTAVMLNLLGSHDTARFLTLANGDQSALRLATLIQMTYPGAPSIYYGDEIGMSGGHDPANRGAFPWRRTESWDTGLLNEFQRLIALRHDRPALRRGSFCFLHARDGVIAYVRQLGDETVLIAINAARSQRRIDLSLQGCLPDGVILQEAWSDRWVRTDQGQLHSLELRPRAGLVLATPALRVV
jgi:neopullulanase